MCAYTHICVSVCESFIVIIAAVVSLCFSPLFYYTHTFGILNYSYIFVYVKKCL